MSRYIDLCADQIRLRIDNDVVTWDPASVSPAKIVHYLALRAEWAREQAKLAEKALVLVMNANKLTGVQSGGVS